MYLEGVYMCVDSVAVLGRYPFIKVYVIATNISALYVVL